MSSSRKKSIISLITMIAFILCINSFGSVFHAEDALKHTVYVNYKELKAEPGPIEVNGITYFPMETLCNALGIKAVPVSTDTYKLTYSKLNREITIAKGNKTIIINGVSHQVSFNVMGTSNNVYMVPLRYIVEQFGGEVNVVPEQKKIFVNGYAPIQFKDKAFEATVRTLIKKPEGDIFKFDVQDVLVMDLSEKGITNVDELKYFENLTYLNLTDNKISDLSVLKNLKGITALFTKNNNPDLDVFTPIAEYYENIKQTDITFDIKFDSNLEKVIRENIKKPEGKLEPKDVRGITDLNASKQKILTIQGLNYLVNLKKLDLSANSIVNIEPLKNLTNLESLSLSGNAITDVSSISRLQVLAALDLTENKIKDITSLKELKKLNSIKIGYNSIEDASPINGLLNLKELHVNNNKLADTCGLERLYLNTLYIKNFEPTNTNTNKNTISKEKFKVFKDLFPRLTKTDLTKEDVLGGGTTVTATTYATATKVITPMITPTSTVTPTPVPTDAIIRFYVGKSVYTVNGKEYKMDDGVGPVIRKSRTGIPIRYIAQHIGAQAGWNEKERKVTITYGDKEIWLYVDIDYAMINGSMTKLDLAPFIIAGRTMVPLRFVSENLGLETLWNGEKQEITIIYKKNK
jgi:Leucine-rich repeat (LRR) protein